MSEQATVQVQESSQASLDSVRLRIRAWKLEVEEARATKALATQEARQAEQERLHIKRAFEARSDQEKKQEAKAAAFERLFLLSPKNLELLNKIFSEAIHETIRYEDLKSLFGPSGLAGELSAHAGSHRKVRLFELSQNTQRQGLSTGTLGFFDYQEASVLEEAPASEISGGTFENHGHGRKHTSKMPAMAITLFRSTLERAGITRENLDLFIEAKEKASQTQPAIPDWKALLALVQEPLAEPVPQLAVAEPVPMGLLRLGG